MRKPPILVALTRYPDTVKLRIGDFTYTYQASEFQIRKLETRIKFGWKQFNKFKSQSTLIKKESL